MIQERPSVVLDARVLLMHVGRIEPKARLLDAEFVVRLRDAAFAQQQRLPAARKRFAEDRPFFQRVLEHRRPSLMVCRAGRA